MGQLYGSVSTRDIAQAISKAGFTVNRQQVTLDRALKTVGLHDVTVRLHAEVSVSVIVNIARTEEEAAIQAEKGSVRAAAEEEMVEEVVEEALAEETTEEDTAE